MSRKLLALVSLFVALIPPTAFVCLRIMPADAFIGLALALMGGVSVYMHSTALEDVATKNNAPSSPPPSAPAVDDDITKPGHDGP